MHLAFTLPAIGVVDSGGDFLGRTITLYGHRHDRNSDRRAAAPQDGENVVDGGPGGRRDHAQVGDALGQRLFVFRVEQSFRQQFRLESFEGRLQCAGAGVLHMLYNELEFAAPLIEGDPAAQADGVAVFGLEFDPLVAVAKHGTAHLGVVVLEGEVPVPGPRGDEVAYLAFDPDEIEVTLQQGPGLAIQLADTERLWRIIVVEGVGQGNFCLPGVGLGFIIARLT